MSEFNLIVSTYRFREEEAQDEIHDLLEAFGDSDAESEITDIKGIILAQTSLDPFQVVGRLKELVSSPRLPPPPKKLPKTSSPNISPNWLKISSIFTFGPPRPLPLTPA